MKIFLATVLLLVLAFVVYAAYFAESGEKLDLNQIERAVKPKIEDLKQVIGNLKERLSPSAKESDIKEDPEMDEEESGPARYPVPEKKDISVFEAKQNLDFFEQPLPELDKSDQPIKEVVDRLLSNEFFGSMLRLEAIIPRFVVTIDNLTNKKLSSKFRLAKPTPGKFLTSASTFSSDESVEKYRIDKSNYKRYAGFIKQIEGIETKKLVAVYIHYYPLIQESYDSLGYSGRYFNDRFVDVIDHLLITPQIVEPIILKRATISYKYDDEDLERRSAGQKIMMRIGASNARKVRKKLRQLRTELTNFEPDL